jgi:hypothetical protein
LTLLAQARGEEARVEALQEPEAWARAWALAIIHHALGHRPQSDEVLRELIADSAITSAFQIAKVYAVRGEVDSAFDWLERAYAQRDPGLSEVKASPRLRSLHGDPRWRSFLTKMGFDE